MNNNVYIYTLLQGSIDWVTHASLVVKMASADVERAKVGVIFFKFYTGIISYLAIISTERNYI